MTYQRCLWTLLSATVLLGSLGAPPARAQRVIGWSGVTYPSGPFLGGGVTMPFNNTYYYSYPVESVYYNPYVAPYPGYGILPPPFATARYYESSTPAYSSRSANTLDYVPRMRSSIYPAVPFEKSPAERLTDQRRVRYEIGVPYADAELFVDGVKTKQTGLQRVFVTPPMEEGREYTSTIKVRWTDQLNKMREREKTFTFVAGQTVPYQFKE